MRAAAWIGPRAEVYWAKSEADIGNYADVGEIADTIRLRAGAARARRNGGYCNGANIAVIYTKAPATKLSESKRGRFADVVTSLVAGTPYRVHFTNAARPVEGIDRRELIDRGGRDSSRHPRLRELHLDALACGVRLRAHHPRLPAAAVAVTPGHRARPAPGPGPLAGEVHPHVEGRCARHRRWIERMFDTAMLA